MKRIFMFAVISTLLLAGCNLSEDAPTNKVDANSNKEVSTDYVDTDSEQNDNTIEGNWIGEGRLYSFSKDGNNVSYTLYQGINKGTDPLILLGREGNTWKLQSPSPANDQWEITVIDDSIMHIVTSWNTDILVKTEMTENEWVAAYEREGEAPETYMDKIENDWKWDNKGEIEDVETYFNVDNLLLIDASNYSKTRYDVKITEIGKGYVKGIDRDDNGNVDEQNGTEVKLTILNSDGTKALLEIEGEEPIQLVED